MNLLLDLGLRLLRGEGIEGNVGIWGHLGLKKN